MKTLSDDEIIKFLEIYEEYPLLWNCSNKYTENSDENSGIYKALGDRLITFGILEDSILDGILIALTKKQTQSLKCKIKYIEETFHAEEIKVKNSLNGTKVYKPKIVWYNNAMFLSETNSLQNIGNDDLQSNSASTSNSGSEDEGIASSSGISSSVGSSSTSQDEEFISSEEEEYRIELTNRMRILPFTKRLDAQEKIMNIILESERAAFEERINKMIASVTTSLSESITILN